MSFRWKILTSLVAVLVLAAGVMIGQRQAAKDPDIVELDAATDKFMRQQWIILGEHIFNAEVVSALMSRASAPDGSTPISLLELQRELKATSREKTVSAIRRYHAANTFFREHGQPAASSEALQSYVAKQTHDDDTLLGDIKLSLDAQGLLHMDVPRR